MEQVVHFSSDDHSSQLLDVVDAATNNAAIESAMWLATHPAWRTSQAARDFAASVEAQISDSGAMYAAAFRDAIAGIQSISLSQSSAGALAILQAAAEDDALRVRLMYLHTTFGAERALQRDDTRVMLAAAVRHVRDVIGAAGGAGVSDDDVASIVWYEMTGKQRAALLENGVPDEAHVAAAQQDIAHVYNILNQTSTPEIRNAYYRILPRVSMYVSDSESDGSEVEELRGLASALASHGYNVDVSTAKGLAEFFGIDPGIMEDRFSMDRSLGDEYGFTEADQAQPDITYAAAAKSDVAPNITLMQPDYAPPSPADPAALQQIAELVANVAHGSISRVGTIIDVLAGIMEEGFTLDQSLGGPETETKPRDNGFTGANEAAPNVTEAAAAERDVVASNAQPSAGTASESLDANIPSDDSQTLEASASSPADQGALLPVVGHVIRSNITRGQLQSIKRILMSNPEFKRHVRDAKQRYAVRQLPTLQAPAASEATPQRAIAAPNAEQSSADSRYEFGGANITADDSQTLEASASAPADQATSSQNHDEREVDYDFTAPDEAEQDIEIDDLMASSVWLMCHPAWRGTADQREFRSTLFAEANGRYGEEGARLLAKIGSGLKQNTRNVQCTDGMLRVIRLAAQNDDLRVLLRFLSRFSPQKLWNQHRAGATRLALAVASIISEDLVSVPVEALLRVTWPDMTPDEARSIERILLQDPEIQRHVRGAEQTHGLRKLPTLQPPAASVPAAVAPHTAAEPHRVPEPDVAAPNAEQRSADTAHEFLVANITSDDSQTLQAWASRAAMQRNFTPPSPADQAALQRILEAVAKVPAGTSSQDRYSALLRLSGLAAARESVRDHQHVIIDMIIGCSKSADVAWLLHQAKHFFDNETADVWQQCRTLVDMLLRKNPYWKLAADLVGVEAIRAYFMVRDDDRPRDIQPRPMASVVRSLLARSIGSGANSLSPIQPLLQLSEQMRAADSSPEQAQAVQKRVTELAKTFDDVGGARQAIHQLVAGERTPQKRKGKATVRSHAASEVPRQPGPGLLLPPTGAKTSTLTPNARATALLAWLVPSHITYVVKPVRYYASNDVRPHHFTKDYEVIEWCTKPLSRLERLFGLTPQHYVLLKERNNDQARLEAFPAEMLTVHAHLREPVTENEVVRFAPSATGPFIVRSPGPQMQPMAASKARLYGPIAPEDAWRKSAREVQLLSQAFAAARAVEPDYDLDNAGQLHTISGTKFEKFCDQIATITRVPAFLPRVLRQRLVMQAAREHISALVRHEERIQARPFLESLPKYEGAVTRHWDAKKHPAEIKTGEILGTKDGEIVLRVGDRTHFANATDFLRQCRFTGVLPENLLARNLPVKIGQTTSLRIQFKKNPEGKGFFIYTPQVDGFVRGYSTPNKRIRMVLQDLPEFTSMPARFHEWPTGSKAMLTGRTSPFVVTAKFRHNHKDYVVAFNQKSGHFEAFDGRYVLDELARTGKLLPGQQSVAHTRVYFERDPSGQIRLQRAETAQTPAPEPNAAAKKLTQGLPPKGKLSFPEFKEEPPPGLCMVLSTGDRPENVVLVYDRTGIQVEVPAAFFIKQHLERGGVLQAPLKPNAKLTLTQTNGHATVTAWHIPGLLPEKAVPKVLKEWQQREP